MKILPHERRPLEGRSSAASSDLAQLARRHGVKPDTLRARLRRNPHWTISEALAYRMPQPLADRLGINIDRTAKKHAMVPNTLRNRIKAHPDWTIEELLAGGKENTQ